MGFNAFDNFMFSFGPIFITAISALVFGFFIFMIIKGIGQWSKNNNSPRLTIPAHVVTKRAHTSGGSGDSSASTWYYATFQVESGDRMELAVGAKEYGMLAEGDIGMLTFQGTRYLRFERK
ncbi:DUF2500 domain-containing protein [Sporosarcina highlanderae]|uniref:DUF2500 domain-containing protein n=1 Tax=Sporosarcina highlanderae TaxID=3035916 RepID=A0ABT8JTM8_9BACL|nr:DUF2500 domain-containing protein [Sporosarcina highlanderae]MDN4607742.1 DUF2500 domain-containing protein [Sporosarcina highlanderae]